MRCCVVLMLGTVLAANCGAASAEEPACSLYKVMSGNLNISSDVDGQTYVDRLALGDVACITRRQNSGSGERGFVAYKMAKPDRRTPVMGWAAMRFLEQLSVSEAATFQSEHQAPAATIAPATPVVAAPAPATADPAAGLRFDQPLPFGGHVKGRSIKELSESVPLVSPIEGLDDAAWKQPCSACHKWDAARLCAQGKGYGNAPQLMMRHPHPFGGDYKIALMTWAEAGCL